MMSFKPTRKSKLQELVDTVSPHVEAARDAAAPHVEAARERLVNDVIPAVQSARDQAAATATAAAETAREQAGPAAAEAKRRGLAATAALKGEEPKRKGGKLKKLLVLGGLAGVVAFVAKKLGANDEQAWQSSYSPKPAPSMAPPPPPAVGETDDPGGGTPGEVLSDSEDQPHLATTPDAPAEVTEIDAQPDENRL